jgi:site-specific recombinase XerD
LGNDLPTVARPQGSEILAGDPALFDALSSAAAYARQEKSEATRRAYRSDFRAFRAWCAANAVSSLPALASTVAAYLATLADGGLKVSTIKRRAAAIAYAHRLAGHEAPTSTGAVQAVLRGISRKVGVAVDAKAPATARIVALMVKRIPGDIAGLRDRALLLLGFAAALRRSELVGLKVNDLERNAAGVIVHIRRSKTDQEGGGHQVAVPRGRKLQVIEALEAWLTAAAIVEGHVFRGIDRAGRVLRAGLTPQSVALIVKRRATAAKLDPALFSGHSLRAGFITSALEDGADLLKVMDVSRHREVKTLKVYDRRARIFENHAGKGFL